jgi:hypothetical protein
MLRIATQKSLDILELSFVLLNYLPSKQLRSYPERLLSTLVGNPHSVEILQVLIQLDQILESQSSRVNGEIY